MEYVLCTERIPNPCVGSFSFSFSLEWILRVDVSMTCHPTKYEEQHLILTWGWQKNIWVFIQHYTSLYLICKLYDSLRFFVPFFFNLFSSCSLFFFFWGGMQIHNCWILKNVYYIIHIVNIFELTTTVRNYSTVHGIDMTLRSIGMGVLHLECWLS